MATLWESLSKENKGKLVQIYEQLTGKKFIPPKRDKRVIKCETKLESPKEMQKIMAEAPNYSVDVQGREG